jgi:glycosyltransferase involved in cell wall biosynthesis
MRFKILEAWALRMPVVSTAAAACGMLINGNIRIADTAEEFADSVVRMLKNQKECEQLGAKARLTVEKHYSWNGLIDKYEKIYYSLFK